MSAELYLNDFRPGQEFLSPTHTLSLEEAVSFAKQYDPQYYHIDVEAAKKGPYGRLIASGWQTAAITMKLKAATELANVAGGLLGLGLESVKWPRPVYPGDTLRVVLTVLDVRRSNSKPTHGVVKYSMDTYNQHDEKVMEAVTAVWVPC
ncbi:MAG: MaoC family dehydratase [Alphaproteobacteria bacterium]|nr:MaoC family dehydratase [Alphaproteobacteria bacterium]